MATDLEHTLQRLAEKSRLLTARYQTLAQQLQQAQQENDALQATLQKRDKELEHLRLQVEYLTIASTIVTSRGDLQQTRQLITNLMRDIDRCIADLAE